MTKYWAHTPPDDDPTRWQTMQDHTSNVADMAASFAVPFGAEELAKWAGWLHDVGKYSKEFQQYLLDCNAAKQKQMPAPKPGSAEHKVAGTKLAVDILPVVLLNKPIAACVLGHHGGLNASVETQIAIANSLEECPEQIATAINRALVDFPMLQQTPPDPRTLSCLANLPQDKGQRERYLETLTRFVFSCLVDADGLDTEHHFRGSRPSWPSLQQKLPMWQYRLYSVQQKSMPDTIVNKVRRVVYEACLQAASQSPGVFTLTVPTGGGKTRSSLAFALSHAQTHGLTRIIYAAPYTSIIDQTATVFREILGRDGILEHHSAIDVRTQAAQSKSTSANEQAEVAIEQQRRSGSENWEAPLIVTTNVQLFESLFANQTSRCRKLHNIARSVIILDEVQTLPPSLLIPLSDGLKTLVERFGVTVVLCTATQPALDSKASYFQGAGLPEPYSIVPNAQEHFRTLRRVTYAQVRKDKLSWESVASEMIKSGKSTLAIVNTKKDALALLAWLKPVDVRHLSTLLCLAHRRQILVEIEESLDHERKSNGPPVYLISTQVIEAGVDIDFPHVFRAKASLDRIVQAAGRCNREGKRPKEQSNVVIFDPEEGTSPPGDYWTALETAWAMIAGKDFDFDDPNQMTEYFNLFYSRLRERGLDREKVQEARKDWNFPLVAQKVRLIKEDTVPVVVPYHNGMISNATWTETEFQKLVDRIRNRALQNKGMTRELWQQIQPLTVSLFRKEVESLSNTLVEALIPSTTSGTTADLWLWCGPYNATTGIGNEVNRDPSDLIA